MKTPTSGKALFFILLFAFLGSHEARIFPEQPLDILVLLFPTIQSLPSSLSDQERTRTNTYERHQRLPPPSPMSSSGPSPIKETLPGPLTATYGRPSLPPPPPPRSPPGPPPIKDILGRPLLSPKTTSYGRPSNPPPPSPQEAPPTAEVSVTMVDFVWAANTQLGLEIAPPNTSLAST